MRFNWKRSAGGAWHLSGKGWIYKTDRYVLLAYVPLFEKSWYWSIRGPRLANGYESDDVSARNAAEMAFDQLLEQDEERSARALPPGWRLCDGSTVSRNAPKQPTQRIYFDGCEGSGKTTLARVTARRYGLPLLTEVASGVLYEFQQREGERARDWDRIRADVDLSSDVQARVFERQLADELAHPPPAVYDRTLSCLAYSELYADNFADLLARVPMEYIENLRQSIVFLVRPQRALLGAADGVRAVVAWEAQVRVDQTIETLLRMWRVDFVSVETLTAASRRQQVDWCLQSRGFRKVAK